MTYEDLLYGCISAEAGKLARELAYLHGFKTECEQSDIEDVHALDIREMGGC